MWIRDRAYLGSGMGKWLKIMEEQGAGKSLAATPYPVLKRGEKQKFTSQNQLYTFNNCVAITTSCKAVEAAAKFLDYGYGEEGHMPVSYTHLAPLAFAGNLNRTA